MGFGMDFGEACLGGMYQHWANQELIQCVARITRYRATSLRTLQLSMLISNICVPRTVCSCRVSRGVVFVYWLVSRPGGRAWHSYLLLFIWLGVTYDSKHVARWHFDATFVSSIEIYNNCFRDPSGVLERLKVDKATETLPKHSPKTSHEFLENPELPALLKLFPETSQSPRVPAKVISPSPSLMIPVDARLCQMTPDDFPDGVRWSQVIADAPPRWFQMSLVEPI